MQKNKLHFLPKRVACMMLAAVMTLSTTLTGCGSQAITGHALEDHGDTHEVTAAVSDETVSLREILADSLDDSLAGQAAELSDDYWENGVPADEEAVFRECAENEDVRDVPEYDTGGTVDLDKVSATTVEKKYDENGLRETAFEVKVMYTTVDAGMLTEDDITDMWNNNYEAFISNYSIIQHLYEAEGYDDCYVAFLDFSALNGVEGTVIAADFTRGTEHHPVNMEDNVVFDKEKGVLYVPKAWYFAGDGTEVGLDLAAQVMVAVDLQDEDRTDEYGNLLAEISVTVENGAGADTVLQTGKYSMAAYDFAVLPLFAPGSLEGLDAGDIEVYINGSAEQVAPENLGYNPESGELTIKTFAMTLSEVRVKFAGKTFLQALAGVFSIGGAKAGTLTEDASGMRPMYNVSTGEDIMPNIDVDKLAVGDVLAYKSLSDFDASATNYLPILHKMLNDGQGNFIYVSAFKAGTSRSNTYWQFVGNQAFNTDKMSYGLAKDLGQHIDAKNPVKWHGFIIEPPFFSLDKETECRNPVLIGIAGRNTSASIKNAVNEKGTAIGTPVYFGTQEEWQWISDEAAGKAVSDLTDKGDKFVARILYKNAVVGQCSHTDTSTYKSGNINVSNACGCHDANCKRKNKAGACVKDDKPVLYKEDGKVYDASKDGSVTTYKCCEMELNDDGSVKLTDGKIKRNMDADTLCCTECSDCDPDYDPSVLFQCFCTCEACTAYKKTDADGNQFCDGKCPVCSEGSCPECSTSWIDVSGKFKATATVRVLMMDSGYMILGLAQLDSGTTQRGTAVIKVRTSVKVGVAKTSSSSMNGAVTGNSCYAPLSTSEYSIYTDEACTQLAGTVAGDGEDYIQIPRGTYWIKETKAPVGYYIDPQKHEVEVTENQWFEFEDDPMDDPFHITAQKMIEGHDPGESLGDIPSLAGIRFEVSWYKGDSYKTLASLPSTADETATFETDAQGFLNLDRAYLASGTWRYTDNNGKLCFPLGTVRVKELSAIDGLKISNSAGILFTITDDSNKTDANVKPSNWRAAIKTIVGSAGSGQAAVIYENAPVKGGVTVVKADADWERSDYQGDAALAGAQFEIVNRSAGSVNYKNKIWPSGAVIDTLTTSLDGGVYKATTGNQALEYGKYEIRESKAPEGYQKAAWSKIFTIRNDNEMHCYQQSANVDAKSGSSWLHRWCTDPVMRGGVAFGKVDRETKQYTDPAAAKLEGSTFQLINKSGHPVRINGVDYAAGAVIKDFAAAKITENGKTFIGGSTGNYVLPYGTYQIKETGAGIGYAFDSESKAQVKEFSIRSHGDMHYFIDEGQAFHNQVQREDWYFQKKAADSGKEMVKVAFKVTSNTTGETHVIVTDENGMYNTERIDHTYRTNSNDPDSPITNGAVGIRDGRYYVKDSSKLDYTAGTWFTGYANGKVTWAGDGRSYTINGGNGTAVRVDDALRAYPYDSYTVEELECDANQGYNLVSFMVHLKAYSDNHDDKGILLDYGTVDDNRVDIETKLGYDATGFESSAKSIPETDGIQLVDVISYAGLAEGAEYTMKGQLHLMDENGKDLGVVTGKNQPFTAKATGKLEMVFDVDASTYAGKTLVATEELWQGDTLLAEEKNLENRDQTVWVSGITGTRADKVYTTTRTGTPVTVTDEVDWVNLEIGTVYTLAMTLVDKETGEAIKDADGNDVKTEQFLIPGANSGTESISVTFSQPEDLAGVTAVVFEEIRKGTVYGLHNDINDAAQTVSFIDMIDTYAVNAETFAKEIPADPGQSIYEAVKLAGLRDDTQYKLEGAAYWFDEEGNAVSVVDGSGEPVTVTIDNPGTEEVMIFEDIDASDLGGRDIVVYQTLYGRKNGSDDWAVAFEHYEADDEDQTVHVPKIDTTMVAENGIHNTDTGMDFGSIRLTDRVDYENLTPGREYRMTGTLHIRDDAEVEGGYEAVDMGEAESIVSEARFTPDAEDGSVEIVFAYDMRALEGKVVVAFEECYTDAQVQIPDAWTGFFRGARAGSARLVAHHDDIADIPQSVGLATITSTELNGENIYTKIMHGVITVIETVKWDGLVPGHVYDINEVFEDASEETKYKISTDGTFTPDTVAGSITMENTREVDTEIRKNTLLAKDNIVVTDAVNYEGLIPGFTYELVSSLMVKNEDGTMNDEPLVTIRGHFIPESVNGTVYATFMFDATSLAGKSLVAYERIYYGDIAVAAHEDPDDEDQTVRFPKLETFFEGVDADGSAEEPIKTIHFQFYSGRQDVFGVSQLQVPSVDIVDTITYTNLIPGSEYVLKGEVHLKSNYNELHDFIKSELDMGTLYCDEQVTFKPDKPNGTLQLVFHVVPVGITAADLVCYEYLFEDDGLVGRHADITSEPQTVTILGTNSATGLDTVLSGTEAAITNNPAGIAGEDAEAEEAAETAPIKTVEYFMHGGHKDKTISLVDTVTYRNLVIGQEYILKGELHLRNRYGADMGIVAFGDDTAFTPEAADGMLTVGFTVDPADFDAEDFDGRDVELVAFEYLYMEDELIMSHAKIRDEDQTVTIAVKDDPITIDTELLGVKIDAPGEDSSITTPVPDGQDGVPENGTAAVIGETEDGDGDDGDTIKVSETYKELVKEVEFNVYDEEDEFGRPVQRADVITLIDRVAYRNLTPGKEYRVEGEIHARGRFGLDLGDMGIGESVVFVPEAPEGTVEVKFTLDPMDIRRADLVAYEYLYEGDSTLVIASHADIMDDGQTVHITARTEPEEPGDLVTKLLGFVRTEEEEGGETDETVSGNETPDRTSDAETEPADEETKEDKEPEPVKVIKFDRHVEKDESGNYKAEADTVTLIDTVEYNNLTPGTEYTMKGEIHIKDIYGRDMGTVSTKDLAFTPDKVYGTVEMEFAIIPDDTDITELVAFEYLYEGGELLKSHADLCDEDQTVVVVMNGNPCGCDEPDCRHKDERDHCLKPGCCNDADCCKDCEQCKHKNPCGCDDPDCRHKDEKDYCRKADCCKKDDCCKKCTDCKQNNGKNPCGCNDAGCKHKDEKDRCKKAGCCDDADCCTKCTQCKNNAAAAKVNDCGCSEANCKYKNVKDHCKKAGCCDGAGCCMSCAQCKSKGTSNGNGNNGNGNNGNSNSNGNSNNGNGNNTSTTTKNPVQKVVEAIKTGQSTFLFTGIIGLAVMAGGGYFFFARTSRGRKLLERLRELFTKK